MLPKSFEDGEVAEAIDFNNNFEAIRDEINSNAPWRNQDISGVLHIDVNCNEDVNALRNAYHANMDAPFLSFTIEGSCTTALFHISSTNSEGVISWVEVQPKNKVVAFGSKVEGTPFTLLPMNVDGREISQLYASFGSGYYFNDAIIQMGADDVYGVLFSRNSNGGLMRSKVIGKGSASGIVVQYGASAYLTDVQVSEVGYGVYLRQAGSLRTFQLEVNASTSGLFVRNGGMVESRGGLKLTAPSAINMYGGTLVANVESVTGSISLYNASVELTYDNSGGTLDSDVSVNHSNLTIITDPTLTNANNLTSLTETTLTSRFTCYGLSFLEIDSLVVNNQGDKGCIDNLRWSQIIKASFP